MNFMPDTFGTNLEELAHSYSYDAGGFVPLYNRIGEKIAAYDADFGRYLAGHLSRVAHDTEDFMIGAGYDAQTAEKVGHAFALHDIGKIKQSIDLWRLTIDKRDLSAEQKLERTKHTDLGLAVLDETIAELGMELDEDQKKHVEMAKQLMLYHHERLDGSGPKTMPGPMMDKILRIVAIIDTVDGKTKAKTLTEIFDDMSGSKHAGQFDDRLVRQYEAYYRETRRDGEIIARPVLAKQGLSR